MRWFQHDCDMHTDLKIQNLIKRYGGDGYMIWCLCLEMVGKEGLRGRLDAKTLWQEGVFKVTGWSDQGKLNTILECLAEMQLIDSKALKFGHLYIPRFMKRADNWSRRVLRSNSGETTAIDKIRIDKNRIDMAINLFRDCYRDKFNTPYVINQIKDRVIIRNILVTLTDEEIKGLICRFFQSEDPFIRKAGYTMGVFKSQINKLRTVKEEVRDGRWDHFE